MTTRPTLNYTHKTVRVNNTTPRQEEGANAAALLLACRAEDAPPLASVSSDGDFIVMHDTHAELHRMAQLLLQAGRAMRSNAFRLRCTAHKTPCQMSNLPD